MQAFPHAFKNGADFIAVGMIDFQIKSNCELADRAIRHAQEEAALAGMADTVSLRLTRDYQKLSLDNWLTLRDPGC